MFPISSKGGGTTTGFPDVCKVPAPPAPFVPTPFPNIGQVASARDTCATVRIVNKPVVTEASHIPRSSGDEAGTLKGMVSVTTMAKVQYKTGSSKVKAKGMGVVHLTSATEHNSGNTVGLQTTPSQTTVLVMT